MFKVGVDIVEIARFAGMDNIGTFKKRVFTRRENDYFSTLKNPYQSIAGAFAAKEAFSKYAGSGFRGFGFHDIEVLRDELGKPFLCFMGKPVNADVSISHSETSAVAVVFGEGLSVSGENFELYKSYRALLPKRNEFMHKDDCGSIFIIAGSVGMTGAACLAAQAAVRCGSGKVTLGTPDIIQPQAAVKLTEAMTLPLPSKNGCISAEGADMISKKRSCSDACAIGPGLGRGEDLREVIAAVLSSDKPCVIDADALNILSEDMEILKSKSCAAVLTPHPGEMSRLTGLSVTEIEADREGAALRLAKEYNSVVLLKGHGTVIAAPNGEVHINPTGNGGMASGGMGDVLTGIIVSLIGQGISCYNAAVLGAFLHGLAGDIAAAEVGEFGLIAGDVIAKLPYAIKSLVDIN